MQCGTCFVFLTSLYISFINHLFIYWVNSLCKILLINLLIIKFFTSFIIENFHNLRKCLTKLKINIYTNVLILIWKIMHMLVISLMINVLGYLRNKKSISKTHLFYSILKTSFKYMDRTTKNYILYKPKLHISSIIYKEWNNFADYI